MFVEGPAADEEPLEIPRMDAKLAEDIVRKWQSIKSKVLGPEHSAAVLQEVRLKILTFQDFSLSSAYSHAQLFMLLETVWV